MSVGAVCGAKAAARAAPTVSTQKGRRPPRDGAQSNPGLLPEATPYQVMRTPKRRTRGAMMPLIWSKLAAGVTAPVAWL
jgi:hypothetical protein